jgi:quinohemoprotein ethanol dehydrogenase
VAKLGWDSRTQSRRVLTFALDGSAKLPPSTPPAQPKPVEDRDFKPDDAAFKRGELAFGYRCVVCHGMNAVPAGLAPDLRASVVPQSAAAFDAIVRDGALVSRGMPRFQILTDQERWDIRQYLRQLARDLAAASDRQAKPGRPR